MFHCEGIRPSNITIFTHEKIIQTSVAHDVMVQKVIM